MNAELIETFNERLEIVRNVMADRDLTPEMQREILDVVLNQTEQKLVKFQAQIRMATNREVGAVATVYTDDALKNEIDSFGAEVAYCKLMGVYPDLGTSHKPYDAKLRNGMTVDVKQTRYANGKLLVKDIERKSHPDLYALMVGQFPRYRCAGHILAEQVLKPERRQVDGWKHPTFVATQDELK
jgi:hypothetical protein